VHSLPKLPETLEEITVWALENATADTDNRSYFEQLCWDRTTEMSCKQIVYHLHDWLRRIVHLECIMTHHTYGPPWQDYYSISLAGIFVCIVDELELDNIYKDKS
jgi:hypothetical protein